MSAGSSAGAPQSDSPGGGSSSFDQALSVTVPVSMAEEAGAVLMEAFGPFEEVPARGGGSVPADVDLGMLPGADRRLDSGFAADLVTLVFYPKEGLSFPSAADALALLPPVLRDSGAVSVESSEVARDWVDGWKDHFRPLVVGRVRIRPPWEPPLDAPETVPAAPDEVGGLAGEEEDEPRGLVDVVINPGLGFGTGLHPTTRGTLQLLQMGGEMAETGGVAPLGGGRGRLLDAGTGSGVLAVAAAKLGWTQIVAFDNDPVALVSARENLAANGVEGIVELHEAEAGTVNPVWSSGATVLANMTLEPVLSLLDQLNVIGPAGRPRRLVVSGILAGAQEQQLLRAAHAAGLRPGERVYEAEWVSLELLPEATDAPTTEGS